MITTLRGPYETCGLHAKAMRCLSFLICKRRKIVKPPSKNSCEYLRRALSSPIEYVRRALSSPILHLLIESVTNFYKHYIREICLLKNSFLSPLLPPPTSRLSGPSTSTFALLQSLISAATRVILLKCQSDHGIPLFKTKSLKQMLMLFLSLRYTFQF